jgi:hypothetical protein
MKRLTTSTVLACANLVLVSFGYLDNWKHILIPEHLPRAISLWPEVVGFVVIPFLVLATLGLAIRDLFRPGVRGQAVIALILTGPIFYIYFVRRW